MKTRGLALALLASLLLTLVGCASTDPENQSARPWNAPKQWETGMPSSILEGR